MPYMHQIPRSKREKREMKKRKREQVANAFFAKLREEQERAAETEIARLVRQIVG